VNLGIEIPIGPLGPVIPHLATNMRQHQRKAAFRKSVGAIFHWINGRFGPRRSFARIKAYWCVFVSFRRLGARIEQTGFALLGHSGHQLADTDYIDRSFDVVGQDMKSHFRPDIL
jgi:hypothetical protein